MAGLLLFLLGTLVVLPACTPTPVSPAASGLAWSMSPSQQTVTAGETATFTVTIERKANINARVNLSVTGFPFQTPAGITVTFDPPRLGESSTSATVRVQTAPNIPANQYSIWVTAAEDGGEPVDRVVVVSVRPGSSSPTAPGQPG
jgi:uncharacterized membrane protein